MKNILLISLTILLLFACKHELERPTWDVDMIVPLAHSQMNINDMLSDSNLNIVENEEGFVSLVFQQEFIDMNLDTLIKIDAIADEQTHTLDSASFNDVVIADTATIGETIIDIPFGTLLFPDGSSNSIPAIANVANEDTINIDASEYFETMTLYKGMLIIEIMNGYPTDLSNMSLSLINTSNQNLIATFSFPIIPTGATVSDSVSIAGQTIDENLLAILHNMDINASNGPVLINYSDAVITTITIADIGITEATAIFPEQQLTETIKEHSFDMGGAQIKEIGIKSGTVTIYVLSTLPNGKMIYNIPSLKKNGLSFTSGEMLIPEATNTDLTAFEFDFQGYVLDLTGQDGRLGGDTINTIYTEAYTFIDSTGELETINYTDSFYSYIEFDITAEYAKGYLGQDTIEFGPETKELTIFNKINADIFDLEKADLKIKFENFIGADAVIQINDFSTSNSNTTVLAGIDQNGNTIIGYNYTIDRASLSGNELPISPSMTEIIIDADEMLEILPDRINTKATFYINPNGQASVDDFLYPEYPIKASINMEIPLSFIAKNLTLIDTTEISISNQQDLEIDQLFITIKNGLPLDANLKLVLLDNQNLVIDTLLAGTTILAASTDANNLVNQINTTSIQMDYTNFNNVKKLISIASFNSTPINEFISIYNNYTIDVTLSAKFKKTIGN
ncbi:MAG: hypothetical protein H8D33_06390 [Cryomorphaceae bacterium]|nr:hypothetical protein [Cryomorphaceae bacterium]